MHPTYALYMHSDDCAPLKQHGVTQHAAEEAIRGYLAPLPDGALATLVVLVDGASTWDTIQEASELRAFTTGSFLDLAIVRVQDTDFTIHPSQCDTGTVNIEIDAPTGTRITLHINDGPTTAFVVPE